MPGVPPPRGITIAITATTTRLPGQARRAVDPGQRRRGDPPACLVPTPPVGPRQPDPWGLVHAVREVADLVRPVLVFVVVVGGGVVFVVVVGAGLAFRAPGAVLLHLLGRRAGRREGGGEGPDGGYGLWCVG